jgi:hypothetical protein
LLSVGAGIDGIIAFSMIWYLMNKRQNSAKRYVYVMLTIQKTTKLTYLCSRDSRFIDRLITFTVSESARFFGRLCSLDDSVNAYKPFRYWSDYQVWPLPVDSRLCRLISAIQYSDDRGAHSRA